jgi:hypothetical protein
MPKFSAQSAIDPIEYDLEPWGPKGALPEPSQDQVETFFRRLKDLQLFTGKVMAGADKLAKDEDVDALVEYAENLPLEELNKYKQEIAPWLSDVSSGALDVEMLRALPHRVFGAFFKYIATELNPKETAD